MSIQFEFEKPKDMPLKCFHCPYMKAKQGYKTFTYQCEHNHCKLEEEKREKEKSNSDPAGSDRATGSRDKSTGISEFKHRITG